MSFAAIDEQADLDSAAEAARLRVVVGRMTRLLRQHNPGGLTQGQLSALVTIEVEGPLRMSELASREGVAAPTMTRVVSALEDSGLLVRAADPGDGRSSLVTLSAVGTARLAEVRAGRAALLTRRVEGLTPDDRRALRAAIPALERLAQTTDPASRA